MPIDPEVQQREILRLIWTTSLGTIYHSERAHFGILISRILSITFWLCILYLILIAPPILEIFTKGALGFVDTVVSTLLIQTIATFLVFHPHSRTRRHIHLSHKFAELHQKIVDLSAKMPEAYLPLFQQELKQLLEQSGPRWPLLNLFCNNMLIEHVKGGFKHICPLPQWKVLLRNVYPFSAPQEPYMLQENFGTLSSMSFQSDFNHSTAHQ